MKTDKRETNLNTFLGMPMSWDKKNMFKSLWNKADDRLFPPKSFGIGWTVNFHAVCKKIGFVSTEKKSNK